MMRKIFVRITYDEREFRTGYLPHRNLGLCSNSEPAGVGWAVLRFSSCQTPESTKPRNSLRFAVTCSRCLAMARSCGNAEVVLASPGIDPGTVRMRANSPAIEIVSYQVRYDC
jgi:hypothetical protein